MILQLCTYVIYHKVYYSMPSENIPLYDPVRLNQQKVVWEIAYKEQVFLAIDVSSILNRMQKIIKYYLAKYNISSFPLCITHSKY